MPDLSTLAAFSLAALALLAIPGPSVLYIVSRSLEDGRRAGLIATAGVHVGTLFHIVAATVGLSSLLLSSALAFDIVRYVGAAYLIFLGVRLFFAREEADFEGRRTNRTRRTFARGVLVNALNPKTALFFFAFLPQFVNVHRGSVALQVAILGLMFLVLGLLSDSLYAVVAGRVGGWLRERRAVLRTQRRVSGGILVGLGIAAAATGSRQK